MWHTNSSCCILTIICKIKEAHSWSSLKMGMICLESCILSVLMAQGRLWEWPAAAFCLHQKSGSCIERHTLNPILIVLNAEITFHHFRRPHPLCAEYTELINLTIDFVHKIYFKPYLSGPNWVEAQSNSSCLFYRCRRWCQYGRNCWWIWNRQGCRQWWIIIQKAIGKKSRTGGVVKKPGTGTSHDNITAYHQYLMSGCGRPFFFSISVNRIWLMLNHRTCEFMSNPWSPSGGKFEKKIQRGLRPIWRKFEKCLS